MRTKTKIEEKKEREIKEWVKDKFNRKDIKIVKGIENKESVIVFFRTRKEKWDRRKRIRYTKLRNETKHFTNKNINKKLHYFSELLN